MDQRETTTFSGSASYYMQRGVVGSGSGLQGTTGMNPLSNSNVPFQSNLGGSSIGLNLPAEASPTMLTHGANVGNVGAPSAVPAGQSVKRKRGRPRKYGPNGSASLALSPSLYTPPGTVTSIQKRGRGRPPGTGRKQSSASSGGGLSGLAGIGFTPHVITVAIGEDVTTKIMSFSQQRSRALCILSANGDVSTVTLRQPSTFGGSVTYEGHFEILCLSGSYLVSDIGGPHGRTGGLSVSLASPDGRVIGGGVGGALIAASPVQVIVGTFLCFSSKTKNKDRGVVEGAGDSIHQTADNSVTPAGVPTSQNLNPTPSMNVWPGSQAMDMQNADVDIDLMRR